jgi:hypothetical protein
MSVLTQLFGNVQTSTDYQNLVALKMNKPLLAQDCMSFAPKASRSCKGVEMEILEILTVQVPWISLGMVVKKERLVDHALAI